MTAMGGMRGEQNVGYRDAVTDIQPFRALMFMKRTDQG